MERTAEDPVEVRDVTKRGKNPFKISELLAHERCIQAVLGFLATTDGAPEG